LVDIRLPCGKHLKSTKLIPKVQSKGREVNMCDYSLMGLPNRLAVSGEVLIVHRFPTGTMGLISSSDGRKLQKLARQATGLFERIVHFLSRPQCRTFTAVCIPPGARLFVRDISDKLRREFGLGDDVQQGVFTQTDAGTGFRDAIRFSNGRDISLQRLHEGQRIRVRSLSSPEEDSLDGTPFEEKNLLV
jgi:hypothetical protein